MPAAMHYDTFSFYVAHSAKADADLIFVVVIFLTASHNPP